MSTDALSGDLIDLPDLIPKLAKLFEVEIRRRWTETKPHTVLDAMIAAKQAQYIETLKHMTIDAEMMSAITIDAIEDSLEPRWNNIYTSGLDSISLYSYVKRWKPRLYLEVGSGNSTMFVRRAIHDHKLSTRIHSIDPEPRVGIDNICDDIIRYHLERLDLKLIFSQLAAGDILFFDGSHRCFANTDVTVFFTEVIPMLPPGVLVGIHDIFLPADYPPLSIGRFYSEQYLLACWLLADAGRKLSIELPVYWISTSPEAAACREILAPFYAKLPAETPQGGGAFWMKTL
jgi:aryl carrier-like protein